MREAVKASVLILALLGAVATIGGIIKQAQSERPCWYDCPKTCIYYGCDVIPVREGEPEGSSEVR